MSFTSFQSTASTTIHITRDFLKLAKYRLSGLVALTAAAGYALRHEQTSSTPQPSLSYYRSLAAVSSGTWLTAASANTLNQLYEIRSDALMARTRLRPLPAARISPRIAASFAAISGLLGVGVLSTEVNNTSAGLAALNLALYAGVYTPLKPISTVNTWIGAVVGAIPPMIGWAGASDGQLMGRRERGAWGLGGLLFFWQIPHFHALAVMNRIDYARGGLRMLAVENPAKNAWWAKVCAGGMVPLGWSFVASGVTGNLFGLEMMWLGWLMYKRAVSMTVQPLCVKTARDLFKVSLWQLPASLGLLWAHKVPFERGIVKVRERQTNEVRYYHPWEIMAPFPFLPVPISAPAIVLEKED